jgi:hypothetical protein
MTLFLERTTAMTNLKQAAETAKAKTSDKRWINAIDKAVDALTNAKWIVTELANCHVITSASGETYKVTEKICQCKSFFYDRPCAHRAAVRLLTLAESIETETTPKVVSCPPRITRSIERDRTGVKVVAVRCDGWLI